MVAEWFPDLSRFVPFLLARHPVSDVSLDRSGVLEGEQLVRCSTLGYKLWCREEPEKRRDTESRSRLNRRLLRPVVTTPTVDDSSEGSFEDWTVLSHPESHCTNIHIYGPGGSTISCLECYNKSIYSNPSSKPSHRTQLRRLQHLSDQDTVYYMLLSMSSTKIYSSPYLTIIDLMKRTLGTSDLAGASSFMFVKAGVSSYTNRQSF